MGGSALASMRQFSSFWRANLHTLKQRPRQRLSVVDGTKLSARPHYRHPMDPIDYIGIRRAPLMSALLLSHCLNPLSVLERNRKTKGINGSVAGFPCCTNEWVRVVVGLGYTHNKSDMRKITRKLYRKLYPANIHTDRLCLEGGATQPWRWHSQLVNGVGWT